jgi:hypothetical protein
VTGLASLIQAVEEARTTSPPRPAAVKQRILYTSDFGPPFDDVAEFGRINFARALKTDAEQWVAKSASGVTPSTFTADCSARRRMSSTLTVIDAVRGGSSTGPMSIPAGDLRRLISDGGGPATLYRVAYLDRANRAIVKLSDTHFDSGAQLLVRRPGQPAVNVSLQNIEDFTACME